MGLPYGVGMQPVAYAAPPPGATARPASATPINPTSSVTIDGTPVRVVILSLAAAASLVALKWAGFRFNVGVSS